MNCSLGILGDAAAREKNSPVHSCKIPVHTEVDAKLKAVTGYCLVEVTFALTTVSTFFQYLLVNCQKAVLFAAAAVPLAARAGTLRLPDNSLILILR